MDDIYEMLLHHHKYAILGRSFVGKLMVFKCRGCGDLKKMPATRWKKLTLGV